MLNDDINRGIATKEKVENLSSEKILQRLKDMGFETKYGFAGKYYDEKNQCSRTQYKSFAGGVYGAEGERPHAPCWCLTEDKAIDLMFERATFLKDFVKQNKELWIRKVSVQCHAFDCKDEDGIMIVDDDDTYNWSIKYNDSYIVITREIRDCHEEIEYLTKEMKKAKLSKEYSDLIMTKFKKCLETGKPHFTREYYCAYMRIYHDSFNNMFTE